MIYTVAASLNSDEPIMLLNKNIGIDAETGLGIDGAAFQQELLDLDDKGYSRIQVWICSEGGVVMDGFKIYNAILKTKTKVDTYCTGIAASIAAVIFQAGRNRVMADYAKLMYHNPYGTGDKDGLDAIKSSLVTMIASRSGKPEQAIAELMDSTMWIGAGAALENGLCDSIENSNIQNAKHGDIKALWTAGNAYINNILHTDFTNKNNTDTMADNNQAKGHDLSLIANYLGLAMEATPQAVLTAIKNKVNAEALQKTKAEEDMEDSKKELSKLKKQLDKLKAEYDEKCLALQQAEEKTKLAEDAMKETKAKNMVMEIAKAGKIKNDAETITLWTNLARNDHDGIKALLDALPINKFAYNLEDKTINHGAVNKYNAATVMAGLAAKAKHK